MVNTLPRTNNTFVSVNSIFKTHWSSFVTRMGHRLRPIEVKEVEKMLSCKEEDRGCFVYYCPGCNEFHFCYFGCNSRLCSCCGKRYADNWAEQLANNAFDVPHKHFTMTLPDLLWEPIRNDRSSLKVLMDSAIQTIKEFYEKIFGKKIIPGCIVVLHPFGRDLNFKPHVHVIATKGGFDRQGKFHEWVQFIPYKILHKKWMAIVSKNLKAHFQNTQDFTELFRLIWVLYGEKGFVVDVCKRTLKNKKNLARYVARYVRHPAIANSRIVSYDDKEVHFFYISHRTKKRIDVHMPIDFFILAIIQHVPEKQFKMIRHYGAYSRNQKHKYQKYLKSSIRQTKLTSFPRERVVLCPKCNKPMAFVWYCKKKPPPDMMTLLDFMQ